MTGSEISPGLPTTQLPVMRSSVAPSADAVCCIVRLEPRRRQLSTPGRRSSCHPRVMVGAAQTATVSGALAVGEVRPRPPRDPRPTSPMSRWSPRPGQGRPRKLRSRRHLRPPAPRRPPHRAQGPLPATDPRRAEHPDAEDDMTIAHRRPGRPSRRVRPARGSCRPYRGKSTEESTHPSVIEVGPTLLYRGGTESGEIALHSSGLPVIASPADAALRRIDRDDRDGVQVRGRRLQRRGHHSAPLRPTPRGGAAAGRSRTPRRGARTPPSGPACRRRALPPCRRPCGPRRWWPRCGRPSGGRRARPRGAIPRSRGPRPRPPSTAAPAG